MSIKIDKIEKTSDIQRYLREKSLESPNNSFYAFDLAKVARKFQEWKMIFPKIEPFYALKSNYHNVLVQFLANLGCGFDCASIGEINRVLEQTKTDIKNIIYAHPCKTVKFLQEAKIKGIKLTTFDSIEELEKIAEHYPEMELVLRIKTDDKKSEIQFSKKFGVGKEEYEFIVKKCKELNLKLIGTSFHSGTGSYDTTTYSKAIEDCSKIFKIGKKHGFEMNFLDIGGGFPGMDDSSLPMSNFAKAINDAIDQYFSHDIKNLRIIAEPGRYFCEDAFILVSKIISRNLWTEEMISKELEQLKELKLFENNYDLSSKFQPKYFISESTCLSFSNGIFEGRKYKPQLIENHFGEESLCSDFYGQSSTKNDIICKNFSVPILNIGEFVYFKGMGAYTYALAKGMSFNLDQLTDIFYFYWCEESLLYQQNFDIQMANLKIN